MAVRSPFMPTGQADKPSYSAAMVMV